MYHRWRTVRSKGPRRKFRITLALVRPFEHIPHLIRATLRSFQISYFSDAFFLFFQFFCSYAEGTIEFGS